MLRQPGSLWLERMLSWTAVLVTRDSGLKELREIVLDVMPKTITEQRIPTMWLPISRKTVPFVMTRIIGKESGLTTLRLGLR